MRRACGGKGQRREQNREQSARMGTGNTERTRLPRRVSPKSDAFFQFSCSRAALESRRLPSADYSLLRTALKCFGRSSKLVPSCFSLYSSFFFPAFVSPSPTDPSTSHPPDHPLTPNRPSSLYVLPASLSLLSFLLSFLLGCFHIDK